MSDRHWYPMHNPYHVGPWHRSFRTIWLQRYEWPEAQKAPSDQLDPLMNAIGLYWTPVEDENEPAPNLRGTVH